MSEFMPNNEHDEFDDDYTVDIELQNLLAEEAAKDATAENSQVFKDAVEVQTLFNAQIFTDLKKFQNSIQGAIPMLDETAANAGLMGKKISLVGPSEAILRPHIGHDALKNAIVVQNTADTSDSIPIVEGSFHGFAIAPIELSPEENPYREFTEEGQPVFRPQLYYQVYAGGKALPQAEMNLFYLGEVGRTSPIFDHEYPGVELQSSELDTEDEQIAIERFQAMLNELDDFPYYDAKSFRKAEEHAFYLLNKSTYANDDSLQDVIVDAVSHYIDFNEPYTIKSDFCLKVSNEEGKVALDFIRVDDLKHLKGGFVFTNAPVHAVSVLQRTYLKNPNALKEGEAIEKVCKNQKALYLTTMVNDETYHIPFEHLRFINFANEE